MIIVSQNRTLILNSPKYIGYDDGTILALGVGSGVGSTDLVELGSYEIETAPLVFEKIIEAYKNGEKVFEMPEVC